ncbi:hypothetical protein EYF80_038308 [Liparis tanakae]|uniref:Uncharacterized protein n=1 Tax=Liparis tanakae TaxID=230148 RepID=A0A4Z2GD33_9TELE|nr:hypothetical protein EYF80_038308 [Liparis tanakae]
MAMESMPQSHPVPACDSGPVRVTAEEPRSGYRDRRNGSASSPVGIVVLTPARRQDSTGPGTKHSSDERRALHVTAVFTIGGARAIRRHFSCTARPPLLRMCSAACCCTRLLAGLLVQLRHGAQGPGARRAGRIRSLSLRLTQTSA